MDKITLNPWKNHPWNDSGKVEFICIDFLIAAANPKPTKETDLITGEICHQEVVWKNILKEGMYEPLMLRINPYQREMRLESGNHRVRMAKKYGIKYLPVASFVTKMTIFNKVNGSHVFYLNDKVKVENMVNCPYDYQILISEHLVDRNIVSLTSSLHYNR